MANPERRASLCGRVDLELIEQEVRGEWCRFLTVEGERTSAFGIVVSDTLRESDLVRLIF